jgi:hypothetical protein
VLWRGVLAAAVIVHIPAGALEVESRSGERALEHAAALGTDKQLLGGELLDLFKFVTALRTTISI